MKYLQWTLLILVFAAIASFAQQPVIAADTPVDTSTLHQWLHSGDPRLIAWAADFARRNHDATILAEMPDWLEHWPMLPPFRPPEWESRRQNWLATATVLDALIQDNASVPLSAVNTVAVEFPIHAAVLISRRSLTETRPVLEQWARGAGAHANNQRLLARVALMMLAKDPGPSTGFWYEDAFQPLGFVGSVVDSSQVKLQITVNSSGVAPGLLGGAACGDSMARKPDPGWPAVYDYLVQEPPAVGGVTIVDLNGDRLSAWRYESNGAGQSGCHGTGWLDAHYIFHELIAFWLGVKPQDMTWWPVQNFGIKWTSKAAYQQQVGEIIESEREKLRATVATLQQRGFLTADKGAVVMPKIVVTVDCDMKPCQLQ